MSDETKPERHLVELSPEAARQVQALYPHVQAMAADHGEPVTGLGDVVHLAIDCFFQQCTARAYEMMQHAETSKETADDAISKALAASPKH